MAAGEVNRSEAGAFKVAVVVATYSESRWEDLLRAIQSLNHQTHPPSEIVVVVDHNQDLLNRARACLGNYQLVHNSNPRGLAGARNSGFAAASSEIVAFIDDDAEALPDWLEKLLPEYLDDRVLGVGGAIEPVWPERPGWLAPEFDWVVGCSYQGLPSRATPVRNLIGCNMSFRRDTLIASGGFRDGIGPLGGSAFALGCDETELCIRVLHALPGHQLIYQPLARVRHRVPVERRRWRYMARRCYAEGLGKAQVVSSVGIGDGLKSERGYVLRTLPSGVVRGFSDLARRRNPGGLARSASIVAGLLLTVAGYCHGRVMDRVWRRAP